MTKRNLSQWGTRPTQETAERSSHLPLKKKIINNKSIHLGFCISMDCFVIKDYFLNKCDDQTAVTTVGPAHYFCKGLALRKNSSDCEKRTIVRKTCDTNLMLFPNFQFLYYCTYFIKSISEVFFMTCLKNLTTVSYKQVSYLK